MSGAGISKADFYRERGKRYELTDAEATVRYHRAMEWIEARSDQVIVDVGCKLALLREYLRVRDLD